MAIYLWNQDINYQGNVYNQIDTWGQYENFGCDGWFCHEIWRPDWCYSMNLKATLLVYDTAYVNNTVVLTADISQGEGPGQIHAYTGSTNLSTTIVKANIQLDCSDGNHNPQSLSYFY